jgi:hypothetical protein
VTSPAELVGAARQQALKAALVSGDATAVSRFLSQPAKLYVPGDRARDGSWVSASVRARWTRNVATWAHCLCSRDFAGDASLTQLLAFLKAIPAEDLPDPAGMGFTAVWLAGALMHACDSDRLGERRARSAAALCVLHRR